jgi:hypothetical protein
MQLSDESINMCMTALYTHMGLHALPLTFTDHYVCYILQTMRINLDAINQLSRICVCPNSHVCRHYYN